MSTKGFVIGLLVGIIVVAALLGAYGLGNSRGYSLGNKDGHGQGYTEGYAQGYTQGSTAAVPKQYDCSNLTLDDMVEIGLAPVEAAIELVNSCGYTHDQAAELATYYKRTDTTGPSLPAVVP